MIETTRRKLFSLMGGAAAAAPLAAKELASVMDVPGAVPPRGFGGGVSAASFGMNGIDHEFGMRELKDARSYLEGLRKPPDHDTRWWGQTDARHLDGLRSVSSVNKARMYREKQEARNRASEEHFARKRIVDWCEKMGIPFARWLA